MQAHGTFEEFFIANYPFIHNYVYSVTGDRGMTDDIVQDTFFEASNCFAKLSKHNNARAWLITAAKYNIRDAMKSRKRKNAIYIEDIDRIPDQDDTYEQAMFFKIDLPRILRPDELEIIRMFYEEGYTIMEIALKQKISNNACKVRLHRIRKKIKKSLSEASSE